MRINVSEVVFREDLYPRINTNVETVQKYAEDLTVLPPIELNQHNELIDGWHRWTAHKKVEALDIEYFTTETASDAGLLELAIERNASHGLQLSQSDKQDMARKIYHATPEKERTEKKRQLAKILSVSERSVSGWLSRIDKDTKVARDKKIFEMWLACYTQEEIAEAVGDKRETVRDRINDFGDFSKLAESAKPTANHNDGIDKEGNPIFNPPIYNVWKQQEKTEGSNHYGNSEVKWVDNLLYLYTKPFDVVIDPFAGGGSTIDICKKRYRRYWVSDRKPVVEREREIRKWDVTEGLPPLSRWKDVGLVYLDPPYWKQAEGKYSNDPTDLANMDIDGYNKTLSDLIKGFAKKLDNAYIALIISPTQWPVEGKKYTDHVGDMLRLVDLPVNMRYSVPYESQQYNGNQVLWAQENKKCLVLTREIIVWEVV